MRDGIDGQHEQVADDARQLAADEAQVVAHLDGAAGERERRRRVLVGDRLHRVEQQIAADQAEHRRDVLERDRLAGERDHLIELALRVAHAAVGVARDQLQRVVGAR